MTAVGFEPIVGPEHVLDAAGEKLDGVRVGQVVRPGSPDEVAACLLRAREAGWACVPSGGGTKLGWSNPLDAKRCLRLDLGRLDHFELDPPEGVARVAAGVVLRDLERAARGCDKRIGLRCASDGATLGGTFSSDAVALDASLDRRPAYEVLGLEAALANGTLVHAGGRVVKNVTGFDLVRLFAGAFGTLGVVTWVWLRLHPRPECAQVLRADEPDLEAAIALAQQLRLGAALPDALAVRPRRPEAPGYSVVWRLAGHEADVKRRREATPGDPIPESEWGGPRGPTGGARDRSELPPAPERAGQRRRRARGHGARGRRRERARTRASPGRGRLGRAGGPGGGAPVRDRGRGRLELSARARAARAASTRRYLRPAPGYTAADARAQAPLRPGANALARSLRGRDLSALTVEPGAERASRLDYAATLDCIHCGLCLPSCPTYQETGRESSSPRGRIFMMRGVAEGRVPLEGAVADEAYFCLACRACESACPAGVRYGHLVESLRAEVDARGARPWRTRVTRRLALRHGVGSPGALRLGFALLRLYQRSGLQTLARRSGVLRLLGALAEAEAMLPPVPDRFRAAIFSPAEGERRGRVALFTGCVMPELFAAVHAASVEVLRRNGFEVEIPPGQVCCGALHLHDGDPDAAARLHEGNRQAFRLDMLDAIVVNSAGCGAALKDRADALAQSTRDICEWLHEVGLRPPQGELPLRVAYDDPCHLLHGQRIAAAPRELLRRIPGLELYDLPGSQDCCGAAGIYNLTHPETSRALLGRKLEALRATAPDVVATGNPGCLLQLAGGVRAAGLPIEVLHPVELLARAYGASDVGASVV